MSFSAQRRADSSSSSTLRGRTYHRAGPPMRYHVCGARSSFSVTNSSKPENGLTVVSFMTSKELATDEHRLTQISNFKSGICNFRFQIPLLCVHLWLN